MEEAKQFFLLSLQELIAIKRFPKKNSHIIVDLSQTKYDLIEEVIQKYFGWKIIKSSNPPSIWHLSWVDTYISYEELKNMMSFQKVNHFPCTPILGKKNLLAKYLQKMKLESPNDYDFFPSTWLAPSQNEQIKSLKNKVFIVKPEHGCQGRGIFLTKRLDQIAPESHFVIQEYIATPFLIDSLKFDFRIYVLLKSVSPLNFLKDFHLQRRTCKIRD